MGERLPWEFRVVEADELQVDVDGPVMLEHREGVFVHSFKCRACRLEFQLFSWVRDRHHAADVHCPECGRLGRKLHWMLPVNDSAEFGSGREIYQLNPHPNSGGLMEDSDTQSPWGPDVGDAGGG